MSRSHPHYGRHALRSQPQRFDAGPATFARFDRIEAFAEGIEPPEWVMIMPLPEGDLKCYGRDGRVLYVPDLQALVSASNAALTRQGGPGPVDKDHEIYKWFGGGGPVVAWAHEFQLRADGVYARTEWLPEAQQLIREKKYRYTSCVVSWRMANVVRDKWDWIESFDIEPTLIRGFGITNIPNLEVRAMFSQQQERPMTPMQRILARFNLGADATPEQLAAAVDAKFADAQATAPPLELFVPRSDYDAVNVKLAAAEKALKDRDQAQAEAEREQLLSAALRDGKVTPASADYHRHAMAAPGGVDAFKKFAATAPVIAGAVTLSAVAAPGGGEALTPNELHACKAAGMQPADYIAARKERQAERAARAS